MTEHEQKLTLLVDILCPGLDSGDLLRDADYAMSVAADVAAEREACAVAAWSAGMEAHTKALGMPCDAREVGSAGAAAIRMRSNVC